MAPPEDLDDVLGQVRRRRPSPLIAWALAPAPDLVEAHLGYVRWLVAGLLGMGNHAARGMRRPPT